MIIVLITLLIAFAVMWMNNEDDNFKDPPSMMAAV